MWTYQELIQHNPLLINICASSCTIYWGITLGKGCKAIQSTKGNQFETACYNFQCLVASCPTSGKLSGNPLKYSIQMHVNHAVVVRHNRQWCLPFANVIIRRHISVFHQNLDSIPTQPFSGSGTGSNGIWMRRAWNVIALWYFLTEMNQNKMNVKPNNAQFFPQALLSWQWKLLEGTSFYVT